MPDYLTSEEAAAYLRFPTPEAFTEFARRHGCSARKRLGKRYLYDRQKLDAWVALHSTSTSRRLRAAGRDAPLVRRSAAASRRRLSRNTSLIASGAIAGLVAAGESVSADTFARALDLASAVIGQWTQATAPALLTSHPAKRTAEQGQL